MIYNNTQNGGMQCELPNGKNKKKEFISSNIYMDFRNKYITFTA